MDALVRAARGEPPKGDTYSPSTKPPSMLKAAMSSAMVNEVKNTSSLGKRVPVLAVKVVGAVWEGVPSGLGEEVYVSVHGQLRDGRVVQSASTRPAKCSATTVWDEELLLPLPADTSGLSAVLLELRGSTGLVGFVRYPWATVVDRAAAGGWALEEPLEGSAGGPAGVQLLGRMLYVDATEAARRSEQLAETLAEASASVVATQSAAESQAVEQASRLRDVRGRLLERHSSGARARTEAEVATFRTEMEDRLHAARDGRQRAFADFNHRKERALGQLLPRFGEAYARAAQKQGAAITTARAEVDKGWVVVGEAHTEAVATLATEREAALARVCERSERNLGKLDQAFCGNRAHEGGVLRRTFGRVEREAVEGCARQSAPLLAELSSQLELHAEGRLALHAELSHGADAVRAAPAAPPLHAAPRPAPCLYMILCSPGARRAGSDGRRVARPPHEPR